METYGIEKLGIIDPKAVYRNLTPAQPSIISRGRLFAMKRLCAAAKAP